MSETLWSKHIDETVRKDAAKFTADQIAAGRIRPDSIAAMTAADLRSGFAAPETQAAPNPSPGGGKRIRSAGVRRIG
jgi:hypothetical protein